MDPAVALHIMMRGQGVPPVAPIIERESSFSCAFVVPDSERLQALAHKIGRACDAFDTRGTALTSPGPN